jgi:hypothetical protein
MRIPLKFVNAISNEFPLSHLSQKFRRNLAARAMFRMLQMPLDALFQRWPLGHFVFGVPSGIQFLFHKNLNA